MWPEVTGWIVNVVDIISDLCDPLAQLIRLVNAKDHLTCESRGPTTSASDELKPSAASPVYAHSGDWCRRSVKTS
jgi:hypothetical protein